MADKNIKNALYEIKKRKDNKITLNIFKEVKEGSDGVILVLNDGLQAVAKGRHICVVGAKIEISEEEGGGSDPQKQKILSAEERRKREVNNKGHAAEERLKELGFTVMQEDETNIFKHMPLDEDENDLEL